MENQKTILYVAIIAGLALIFYYVYTQNSLKQQEIDKAPIARAGSTTIAAIGAKIISTVADILSSWNI